MWAIQPTIQVRKFSDPKAYSIFRDMGPGTATEFFNLATGEWGNCGHTHFMSPDDALDVADALRHNEPVPSREYYLTGGNGPYRFRPPTHVTSPPKQGVQCAERPKAGRVWTKEQVDRYVGRMQAKFVSDQAGGLRRSPRQVIYDLDLQVASLEARVVELEAVNQELNRRLTLVEKSLAVD